MDDILRPKKSPTAPATDIAGVTPRQPAAPTSSPTAPRPVAISTPDEVSQDAPVDKPGGQTLEDLHLDKPDTDRVVGAEPAPVAPEAPVPQAEPTTSPAEAGTPASPAASNSSLLAEIEAQERADAEARVTPAPTAPAKRKGGRAAAIIVAVIIALALVAGAGYAYWSNNKDKTSSETTKQTTTQTMTETKVTGTDVDKVSSDIDAAINKVDDTKDFPETDLNDSTLGIQ